jgi:hypothetical protein
VHDPLARQMANNDAPLGSVPDPVTDARTPCSDLFQIYPTCKNVAHGLEVLSQGNVKRNPALGDVRGQGHADDLPHLSVCVPWYACVGSKVWI